MIGSRLRQFRLAQGLTLDELAGSSKVSRGTIHRIELNQVSPRLDTLADLCRALGISLGDFFRMEDSVPGPGEGNSGSTRHPEGFRKGTQDWLEHMEALVRFSADSLCVLDREGFLIYESEGASRFHAEGLEPRRSRPWWTWAHPDEQEILRTHFQELLLSGESRCLLQYRILHRDGSWHWVRTAFSRQLDQPLIHGVIASTQDVTLLKRIEEGFYLAQKWESLATAVGGLTHTFSNLLMVVQANLQLAQTKVQAETGDLPDHLQAMQEALQRATHLLNRMRDYVGNPTLPLGPVDLNTSIQALAPGLLEMGREGHIFHFELGEPLPPLKADPNLLARLLADLVANACDALGEGTGRVTLRTAMTHLTESEILSTAWIGNNLPAPGNHVVLEVSDSGCGIDPEILPRIFDPFFTTKFMGRGMGLPTVLGTVRTHGGGLRVTSEPGQGTSVQIFLPPATATASDSTAPPAGAPSNARRRAILIAEDDSVLRECIRAMLEGMGYHEVLEAENGAQALRLYQEHAERVGLVLLDLNMPIMDGAEAFTRLRKLDPALNILFSTGAWERDPRLATRVAQGPTGILHKPYRMEQLKAALATFA